MAAPRTSQRGGDSNPATVKELSSAIVAMAMQDHIARDLGLTQALTRPRVPRGPRLRQRGQGGPEGGPSRGTGGGPGGGPSGGPDEEREYVLGPRAPPLTLAQRLCLVPAPQGAALSQEEWRFVKSRSAQRDLFSLPCVICRDELGAHTQVLLSCSHVFHQAAGVVEGRLCPGAVPPPPRVRAAPRPRAAPPLLREQAAGAGRASGSCVRLRRGRLPAGDGGGARAASTAERGGERQLGLGAHRGHGTGAGPTPLPHLPHPAVGAGAGGSCWCPAPLAAWRCRGHQGEGPGERSPPKRGGGGHRETGTEAGDAERGGVPPGVPPGMPSGAEPSGSAPGAPVVCPRVPRRVPRGAGGVLCGSPAPLPFVPGSLQQEAPAGPPRREAGGVATTGPPPPPPMMMQ
ncbi:uncharacterized protein LOC144943552 isoform X4 [Lampetra fluviatilis]